MPITVEVDLFSGRPNPRWPLTEAEARDLAALLAGRSDSSSAPPPLGYRGFVIHLERPLRIYREPSLERWLLRSASHSLAPAICALISQQLSAANGG